MEYVKVAKSNFRDKLFPGEDEETEVCLEVRTHLLWFDQVLKPTSTRFIRAKIADVQKVQNNY